VTSRSNRQAQHNRCEINVHALSLICLCIFIITAPLLPMPSGSISRRQGAASNRSELSNFIMPTPRSNADLVDRRSALAYRSAQDTAADRMCARQATRFERLLNYAAARPG